MALVVELEDSVDLAAVELELAEPEELAQETPVVAVAIEGTNGLERGETA
jgi:hypothetical protein